MTMALGRVSAQPVAGARELRTVMIDPGHGGNDPGAVANGVNEKDIVLDVSLRLGKMIKEAYPGVQVLYTRSKDVFIPLHARASAAVRHKADLFISVHANWVSQTSVRGTETFTLGLHRSQENLEVAKKENAVILLEEDYSTNYEGFNPNETESYIMFENMQSEYQSQSISLAAHIQEEFTRQLNLSNRGVKQAGFLVLRQITMPGVLVEIGFISHPAERKFLASDEGKRKVAGSLFKAFATYKKEIDSRSRFTPLTGDTALAARTGGTRENNGDRALKSPETKNNQETPSPETSSVDTAAPPLPAPPKSNPDPRSHTNGNRSLNTAAQNKATANTTANDKANITAQNKDTARASTNATNATTDAAVWYAVQIGAVGKDIPPTPSNFKGVKDVYRIRVAPYYKYYTGKCATPAEAVTLRNQLSSRFPQAFIVIIENGTPRALQKSELP